MAPTWRYLHKVLCPLTLSSVARRSQTAKAAVLCPPTSDLRSPASPATGLSRINLKFNNLTSNIAACLYRLLSGRKQKLYEN
jgi:hypothetical protein